MKQGIALLNENTEASLTTAVQLFDQALAYRRTSAEAEDHWASYLTAASWMNRADALTRLGRPEQLAEAVRSYDEAVALMCAVPLEVNPLYRRRLAIAWMNRGITLLQQGTAESFAAAVDSCQEAIAAVRGITEHAMLEACAWMNQGNALLRVTPSRPAEARDAAQSALPLLTTLEQEDLLAAETALKARYILCQAAAELLASTDAPAVTAELVSAATDAAEDGMRLARAWETRGEKGFRALWGEFFCFGLTAYQHHQRHFLPEFVRENLENIPTGGGRALHLAAMEALGAMARVLQADGFAKVHTPQFDLLLECLNVLQVVENRLDALEASA